MVNHKNLLLENVNLVILVYMSFVTVVFNIFLNFKVHYNDNDNDNETAISLFDINHLNIMIGEKKLQK